MTATRSYYIEYEANEGTLLGGAKRCASARCDSYDRAVTLLDVAVELNGGPAHCTGRVVESTQPPEIFLHCGKYPAAVGARCAGCGKVLTTQDAERAPLRDRAIATKIA